MFNELVDSSDRPHPTHKKWTVGFAAAVQSLMVGLLILGPLIYTEALPPWFFRSIILAPPPPVPPRQLKPLRTAERVRVIPLRNLTAPVSIPSRIVADGGPPVIYVESPAFESTSSAPLGNLFGSSAAPTPPPPGTATPRRIVIGGSVQAALLITRVLPQYPFIAQHAGIYGTIRLHAIIAKDGTIQDLNYISGPPLLLKSAIDAVRQWRYRPTLLNGQPVEVETTIDVVFALAR